MKKIHSPTKQKVLLLLLAGVALGLTRSPSGQKRIIQAVIKDWKKINRYYLYRILDEFHNERLVDYREQADGKIKVVLTEAGKKRAMAFDLDRLEIKKPPRWDKKWRVVLYDVPEKKKPGREALREKLKELGFYEWQKSVWVHPYPCRDEIDFVSEVFDLRPYIRYAEFQNPTNDAQLKLHFDL